MQKLKADKLIFNKTGGKATRKKNVFLILAAEAAALFILALFPVWTAYAANQILVIDASHVYEGMDKTYVQGYQPRVSDSEAFICLPLVVSEVYGETIENNEITIKPDLGDFAASPFKPGDYGKTVSLAGYAVTDEDGNQTDVNAYYVTLSLPLQAGAVNGRYPVVLQLSYVNNLGESIQQSFTVYVGIAGGIPPTPTPFGGETVEESGLAPRINLSGYKVTPEVVPAGSSFTVDITLQNTSGTGAVSNIVVSYNGVTGDIVPDSGANTLFVSGIEQNAEQIFHIKMKAHADAKTSTQKIIIIMDYHDENGVSRSNTSEIPVQVKQPIRIKYDPPGIPEQVYAGENISASLNIYNLGKNILYNVAVSLAAEGFTSKEDTYIGNIEPGGAKTAEITANTENKPGVVNGKFVVWYEDESGEQYSEEVPFTTKILYMRTGLLGLSAEWAVLGWCVAAVGITAAAYLIRKLIHKRMHKEDARNK